MLGFCFFGFFDACQRLVHLVVVLFVFFGACQCLVALIFPNTGRHKEKAQSNKTLAGTKNEKTICGSPESWVDAGVLLFLFFWCMPLFCEIVLCFFLWCLPMFGEHVCCWKLNQSIYVVSCSWSFKISCPPGPQRKLPEAVRKPCFATWPFRSSLAR